VAGDATGGTTQTGVRESNATLDVLDFRTRRIIHLYPVGRDRGAHADKPHRDVGE
jgi:hypothetical protein